MTVGDFIIRPAVVGDLQNLTSLYQHLSPTDPVLAPDVAMERFSAILAQPGMTVFIGVAGEIAAATVTLIIVPNLTRNGASYALIENVVTHADHRRQGLGRRVLAHALDLAWQADCYKVLLATGSKRETTLRFYEEAGFLRGGKTYFEVRRP